VLRLLVCSILNLEHRLLLPSVAALPTVTSNVLTVTPTFLCLPNISV
jgi:hypothetical protein